jgi:hypothetical protein
MRVELPGISYWRHELTGCMHITMAVLLSWHGYEPLEVLGAAWGFRYQPEQLRREEYYLPGAGPSLLSALAPYHPVTSAWHQPASAGEGWRQVRAAVAAGRPVAVAADNYHLPFRPAYQDVHTNHLITVYGFDDERDEVLVADPVPPKFQGPIRIGELGEARDSGNPVRHDRDLFFTGVSIGSRWLDITATQPMPACDPDFIRYVITANVAAFCSAELAAAGSTGGYVGLAGQRRFLDDVAERMALGRIDALDEVFIVAGPILAVTALHASWLVRAARTVRVPRLAEAARRVERIAHHWSAIRIITASRRADPALAAHSLRERNRQLEKDQRDVLDLLSRVAAAL